MQRLQFACNRFIKPTPLQWRFAPLRTFSHSHSHKENARNNFKFPWMWTAFGVGVATTFEHRKLFADAPVGHASILKPKHKVYDKLYDPADPVHPADLATGLQKVWNVTQFWLRTVGTILAGIACCVVIIPVTIVNYLIGNSRNTFKIAGGIWYQVMSRVSGIRVEVEGQENLNAARPCVMLIVPHQSSIDVLVASKLCVSGVTFFGKKEIGYIPFFNVFAWLSPMFLIDRGNHTKALESMNRAVESMKRDNLALMLFPEGTRTRTLGSRLLPLKKGGFHIALDNGFPIVPVVIENYADIYYGKKQWWKGGVIKVKVLPPMATSSLNSSRDLEWIMNQVRKQMEGSLTSMKGVDSDIDD